jgi:hypothetical protein
MPVPDAPPKVTVDPLPAIAQDLFCQTCGYNLRGLTGNRCPECGGSLDGVRSLIPQIPWVYRKEIGWFRAYWRTVWFVMIRQARFCDEMARPVSYRDCQSFRWVTVLMTAIPFVPPLLALHLTWKPQSFSNDLVSASSATIAAGWPLLIFNVCCLLFLAAATGVPSYFFHPRDIPVEQQNRAIALSYYACGPLVFLTLPILTCAAAILTGEARNPAISMLFIVLTVTLPIGAIAPWWLDLIHLARRLVPQRPQRAVYLAVCVPILWFLLALAFLVGIPFVLFYFFLIVASLS